MSIRVALDIGEKCAVCGKALRTRDTIVFYFKPNTVAGGWHARCGPLPHVEGLTVKQQSPKMHGSEK